MLYAPEAVQRIVSDIRMLQAAGAGECTIDRYVKGCGFSHPINWPTGADRVWRKPMAAHGTASTDELKTIRERFGLNGL